MLSVKAWIVHPVAWPEAVGIAAAETRGRATYLAALGSRDAGYEYGLTSFRTLRAAELDAWAVKERELHGPWVPEAVPGGVDAVRARGLPC